MKNLNAKLDSARIVTSIRNIFRTIIEEEIAAKIMRYLTPTYDSKIVAIGEVIPLIIGFNIETLIGKLQAFETYSLKYYLLEVDFSFKATIHKYNRMPSTSIAYEKFSEYIKGWKEIEQEESNLERTIVRI